MVAHLHFLPTLKPTLKNAKELQIQRTILDNKKRNGHTEKGTTAKTQPFLDLEKPKINCNHRIPIKKYCP